MKSLARAAVPALMLALLCAATLTSGLGARVARQLGDPLELRSQRRLALEPAQVAQLRALEEEVLITYVVSPPEQLPSEWARSAREVERLLRALERAAPERVHTQVLHPSDRPELPELLHALGLEPFRASRVERDALVERELWSSLHVATGPWPSASLPGVGPAQLPHLAELVLGLMREAARPRAPRIGLVAPEEGFERLRERLQARGELVRLRAQESVPLPADVDLLFWLDPPSATAEQLRALEAQLASGRSVVLSASAFELAREGARELLRPRPTGLDSWLDALGVDFAPEPLFDERCAAAFGDPRAQAGPRPERVACIAPQQDFRSLIGQPNGTLVFEAARPLFTRPQELARQSLRAHVLASSSAAAWLESLDERSAARATGTGDGTGVGTDSDAAENTAAIELPSLAAGAPAGARPLARAPLALHLESSEALVGDLIVLSSSTPLRDGELESEACAHEAFLELLLSNFTSAGRRVRADALPLARAPRAPLSRAQRLTWRLAVSLPMPLVLLLLAALRRTRRARCGTRSARAVGAPALAALAALALLSSLGARLAPRASFDWTTNARHSLDPRLRQRLHELAAASEIQLVLYTSPEAALPPAWRPALRRLRARLQQFARAEPRLRLRESTVRADAALAREQGLQLREAALGEGDERRLYRFVCELHLSAADASLTLGFERLESFDELDLRTLSALAELRGEAPVRVAFAGGRPSLSPAEARLQYEARGLFAPGRGDVFGAARRALADAGFEVVRVDPEHPRWPQETDVLVWLGPRRDASPLLALASDFLARGGRALIGAQPFDVQRSATDPDAPAPEPSSSSCWPRPLYPDVDRLYLAPLGVELAPELLFDELRAPWSAATPNARGAPASFALRVVRANFGQLDALAQVGELRCLSPGFWRLDPARLAQRELSARPCLFSSDQCWTYEWQGGQLPGALLGERADARRAAAQGLGGLRFPERGLALGLDLRGRFPRWRATSAGGELLQATSDQPAGRLLLLGSSTSWQDEQLEEGAHENARALVALVTELGLGSEGVGLLSRSAALGFDLVAPPRRLFWRACVLGLFPALSLALWIARAVRRSRPRRGSA